MAASSMTDKSAENGQLAGANGQVSNDGAPDQNLALASISQKLKDLFKAEEQEPIPERFIDLLDQLEKAEQKSKQQAKD